MTTSNWVNPGDVTGEPTGFPGCAPDTNFGAWFATGTTLSLTIHCPAFPYGFCGPIYPRAYCYRATLTATANGAGSPGTLSTVDGS